MPLPNEKKESKLSDELWSMRQRLYDKFPHDLWSGESRNVDVTGFIEDFLVNEIAKALELQRERIVEKLKPCLDYCKQQNGLPYCKNCGLSDDLIKEL